MGNIVDLTNRSQKYKQLYGVMRKKSEQCSRKRSLYKRYFDFFFRNFYVKHLAPLITKFVYSQMILVFKNEIKNISLFKNLTLLRGPPYFEGSLSEQLELSLYGDDCTQVTAFLTYWLQRKTFVNIFSKYFCVKIRPLIVASPYPLGSQLQLSTLTW